jgi:hypothetical protein
MREILFRLIYDCRVVGYELHDMGQIYHTPCIETMEPMNIIHPQNFIKHDWKQQYIGTKDKNGKRIFEGMRVCTYTEDGIRHDEPPMEVRFQPGGFYAECHDGAFYEMSSFDESELEIHDK